jgi:hypothetical protein
MLGRSARSGRNVMSRLNTEIAIALSFAKAGALWAFGGLSMAGKPEGP